MHTHPHLQAHGVYTYIVRGDSRHNHVCAYAHAVLAYLHVLACTPTRAWCIHTSGAETRDTLTYACAHTELAYLHTYTRMVCMHKSCAETRDTLTYAYIHIHGVPGDIRVLACTPTRAWCIYTLWAETRDIPTHAYAHAVLAYLHAHMHTYTRVHMHTSCAETRDTLTYAYIHTRRARKHPCTRMHTYTRMLYTYTVRGDSRHTHICIRTCLASRHPCTHTHTHTSTCMRMVYNTSCAETRDTLACTYAHAV